MTAIIQVENLVTQIQNNILHDQVSFDLQSGEILGIVGGSGSGKSVLLRVLLGLLKPVGGRISFWQHTYDEPEGQRLLRHMSGVMFQNGALFSSLTVQENLWLPMHYLAQLSRDLINELIAIRLEMVGLPADTAYKYPSELSGGMIKRVALARAIALDPCVLFLDEPTAGLDPIAAEGFDNLLKNLQRNLGLSVIMVTHDLDSLYALCNRVAVLVDKKIIVGSLKEMQNHPHPWIKQYFKGPRGRAAAKGG